MACLVGCVAAWSVAVYVSRKLAPAASMNEQLHLLQHDPDYLGDITNAALVDLLDDETVAHFHPRIRAELRDNRGLTERAS